MSRNATMRLAGCEDGIQIIAVCAGGSLTCRDREVADGARTSLTPLPHGRGSLGLFRPHRPETGRLYGRRLHRGGDGVDRGGRIAEFAALAAATHGAVERFVRNQ